MQVAQYTYQSPSSSAVQVGKLDPSSVKDESKKSSAELPKATNETLSKAQGFQATQVQEVKPTVTATSIDTYA
jgi:hypothetical protein